MRLGRSSRADAEMYACPPANWRASLHRRLLRCNPRGLEDQKILDRRQLGCRAPMYTATLDLPEVDRRDPTAEAGWTGWSAFLAVRRRNGVEMWTEWCDLTEIR